MNCDMIQRKLFEKNMFSLDHEFEFQLNETLTCKYKSKGLSQSPDVVQLQILQKLLAERLLLEFLVHFSGQLHNIRTLGQAL